MELSNQYEKKMYARSEKRGVLLLTPANAAVQSSTI